MEDIIAQFIKLPQPVKRAVSSPDTMSRLEEIEARYDAKLADIVMRVAVKNIPLSALEGELVARLKVEQERAKKIAHELKQHIFSQISKHLGFDPSASQDNAFVTLAHESSLGVMQNDPEIEKHSSNLSYAPGAHEFDVDQFTDQLVDLLGIGLDHVMKKRFLKIIESRLKDVRDKQALIEQLERSTKIGGMGFSREKIQKITPVIERAWEDIHTKHLEVKEKEEHRQHPPAPTKPLPQKAHPPMSQQREVPPMPSIPKAPVQPTSDAGTRPQPSESQEKREEAQSIQAPVIDLNQGPTAQETQAQQTENTPTPIEEKKEPHVEKKREGPEEFIIPSIEPPMSALPDMKEPVVSEKETEKWEQEEKKEPPAPETPKLDEADALPPPKPKKEVPHFMPKVQRDFDPNKKTVQDIVPPSKLIGPVEELGEMDIQDFRHLGSSPEESADRLKEKIRMLEKESFERRSQGVKAWRKSPLMQEYLAIGRESIENNRDFKQLIMDRRKEKPQSMTSEEFDAVSSVNSSLRY